MEPDYHPTAKDRLPASMRFLPVHTLVTVTLPAVGELRDAKGRPYPANRAARRAARKAAK
jgi:hypothetical protein